MLIEPEWLNMWVKTKLRHSSGPNMILQPHTWTLGIAFIDHVTDVNNSRGRKQMYPSSGLRATCLSRGRKRIWFWYLRVAAGEKWYPPTIAEIITFRKSNKTTTTAYRSSRKKTPFTKHQWDRSLINTMPGGRRSAKLCYLGSRRDWSPSLPGTLHVERQPPIPI
jgi:hypothetical protein